MKDELEKLDILRGGEYFGSLIIFGGRVHTETAIAQTDCCILRISAEDFEHILSDHPDVTRKVLEAVSQQLAETQEIVKQLSAYTAEGMCTDVHNYLRDFKGVHKGYLSGYVVMAEFRRNLKRISPEFIAAIVALHSVYT